MLSIKAIYDGEKLVFDEKIKINSPHEMIATFIDETLKGTSHLH